MIWIILLIILGLILFFAELVLLPGITVAGIGAFICLIFASTWAFTTFGLTTGFIVLAIILVCLIIMLSLFLRAKTWRKLSLNTKIENSFDEAIDKQVAIGAKGISLTRLAPIGKVEISGRTYEAKSPTDYIDQQTSIIVIGYENFSLIVNSLNK